MSDQRKDGISWCDETWNPIRGCSKVSDGCKNCFAESMAARFCGDGLPYHGLIRNGHWSGDVRFVAEKLDQPLRWKRPRRIFVNSMSDLFHDSLTNEQIAAVFGVMAACPRHTFQVLTKRAKRMKEWFEWANMADTQGPLEEIRFQAQGYFEDSHTDREWTHVIPRADKWPLPNVHLGVSCENQAAADERIPYLRECPAALRFLSLEPLLENIDLRFITRRTFRFADGNEGLSGEIGWVICGGESGPNARPMHPDWARSIRDQCKAAGVPFHFKQNGEWLPGGFYDGFIVPDCMGAAMNNPKNMHYFEPPLGKAWRVGKRQAGHLLDGREYRMWPGDEW